MPRGKRYAGKRGSKRKSLKGRPKSGRFQKRTRRSGAGRIQMLRNPTVFPQQRLLKMSKILKVQIYQGNATNATAGAPQYICLNLNSPWFMSNDDARKSNSQAWVYSEEPQRDPDGHVVHAGSGVAPTAAMTFDHLYTADRTGPGNQYKDFCVVGAKVTAQFSPQTVTNSTNVIAGPGILFSQLCGDLGAWKDATGAFVPGVIDSDKLAKLPFTQTSKFEIKNYGGPSRPGKIVQTYSPKMLNAMVDVTDKDEMWGHVNPEATNTAYPDERDFLVLGVMPQFNPDTIRAAQSAGTLSGAKVQVIPDGLLEIKIEQTIRLSEPNAGATGVNAIASYGYGSTRRRGEFFRT